MSRLIPRPSDVVGVLPGVDAEDVQRDAESATEGVVTGTPPPIAPGPGGATGGLRGPIGFGAVIGGSAADGTGSGGGNPFGISIPWYRIGLFVILLFAVKEFFGEAAEELL